MNAYLQRYSFCQPTLLTSPDPDTGIIVVIPCFNEPDLIRSLESLFLCDEPSCRVEVLIVLNSGEHHSNEVKRQNQHTAEQFIAWKKSKPEGTIYFHLLEHVNLPQKHAGVGLARKIGMDEAVHRFHQINRDGIIACFDADSLCDKNYLVELENHFVQHPKTPGCSIYFEHPTAGNEFSDSTYQAIVQYELHLRYYVEAMRFCDLPYAFHTIGSSMAVRSSAYQKQGGMNRRKAGEDFYFLHKIIQLGGFSELNTTRIIPSPRISDRVPFGTGRAMGELLAKDETLYETYSVQSFHLIKNFVRQIPELRKRELNELDWNRSDEAACASFVEFIEAEGVRAALDQIRANSTTESSFIKRFFVWFDAFKLLKAVHFLRDRVYPNQEVVKAIQQILPSYDGLNEPTELLEQLRSKQRRGTQ